MRICANENLPADSVIALRASRHDVLWVRESMPGARDDAVLARARAESRLLLTFDKDFGALVFQRGAAASIGIVLFRAPQMSSGAVALSIVRTLESRSDWAGHFCVVDEHTIRMRKLP